MSPRKQLRRYRELHEPKLSVLELASLLSCSHQMVYALEAGTQDKVPGLLLAARIESVTGIPRTDWDRVAHVNHQRPRLKTA